MSQERIREDILFVKEQLDELFRRGTKEAHEAIVQIGDMEYVRLLAEGDTELSIVELLISIHKAESAEGIQSTVLCAGNSLEELLDIYYQVLFYLQRIWFEVEAESWVELIEYVQKLRLTPLAVYMILEASRIKEKKKVWETVKELWENQHES